MTQTICVAVRVCHAWQWENLLHLDTIKARSKPLAPPKKPEAAPFFLPTVPGLSRNPVFTADGSKEGEEGEDGEAGEGCSRGLWEQQQQWWQQIVDIVYLAANGSTLHKCSCLCCVTRCLQVCFGACELEDAMEACT
jgi:hypothetical protein